MIKLQTCPIKLLDLVRVLSWCEYAVPWSIFCHLEILNTASGNLLYIHILILNDNDWNYNGCEMCIIYSIQMKIREVRKYLSIPFICIQKALQYM